MNHRTIANILAYFYQHPTQLTKRQQLPTKILRTLAEHINVPSPHLTKLHHHQRVTAHLILLYAAGWLHTIGSTVSLTPQAWEWLWCNPNEQCLHLLHIARRQSSWSNAVQHWKIDAHQSLICQAFVEQALVRLNEKAPVPTIPVKIQPESTSPQWVVTSADHYPMLTYFQLYQFTQWKNWAQQKLTPLSIGYAAHNEITLDQIIETLETATTASLPPTLKRLLTQWHANANSYQLNPVYLLTTQRQAQLDQLLQRRQLRTQTYKRIGPRHVVVSSKIERPLRRWLHKQGIPLATTRPAVPTVDQTYLAKLVLAGVGRILSLSGLPHHVSPPEGDTPHQIVEAEQRASQILSDLRRTIAGFDQTPVKETVAVEALINWLDDAIETAQPIQIHYQGLTDEKPRWRTVEPEWIETRNQLTYLHAFCHVADDERVFRVDRIRAIEADSSCYPKLINDADSVQPNHLRHQLHDAFAPLDDE